MAEIGTEAQQAAEAAPVVVRIFVGGLGERVSDDDLQKIFSSRGLGKVETVEIIRTKGRSFAYIDFFPSADNSISKLFSTYNGCAWKGGKLRLEKAKEDYLARLKKEWAEDAAKLEALSSNDDKKVEPPPLPTKEDLHDEKMSFFFPRLGKVKAIPLTGSGKHKYSFRRVEVPPLPTYFCDCEEHGGNAEPVKRKQNLGLSERDDGLNEQEINLMNSVMNKLLQREAVPKPAGSGSLDIEIDKENDQKEAAAEADGSAGEFEDQQVDDDSAEDEDNIIINIVGKKGKPLLGSQEAKLDWRQDSNVSHSGNELKQHRSDSAYPKKETKSSFLNGDGHLSESLSRSRLKELDISLGAPSTEKGKGVKHSTPSVSGKRKSSWKELVGQGSSSTFSISEVLTTVGSSKKKARKSDNLSKFSAVEKNPLGHEKSEESDEAEHAGNGSSKQFSISEVLAGADSSNKEMLLRDEQSEGKLSETELTDNDGSGSFNVSEVQTSTEFNDEGKSDDMTENSPESNKELTSNEKSQLNEKEIVKSPADVKDTKQTSTSDKSGRGSAWLHKSSWTQLVSGSNGSLFRISEILPGGSTGKQTPSVAEAVKPASSTGDQHDDKLDLVEISEPVKDLVGSIERDVEGSDEASQQNVANKNEGSSSTAEKEPTLAATKLVIGETCSFMRSAASLKEWQKAKAALKGSGKRKRQ
ncbi:unnamed protein product [Linum trigynum]|uniref:RRM domain-containing protein n=1 Tax=Linum trigynum TaxID=586398 RepID=A0AAV2GD41_9ROSI